MLDEVGFQDPSLVTEMAQGFRLVGLLPCSGEFPLQLEPASLDQRELWATAKWSQCAVLHGGPPAGDLPLWEAVYTATSEEVAAGWLVGPLTAEEVTNRVGPLWVPSRRFGVVQGSKVRPIDDFSEFWVNEAVTTQNKLDLGGVDELAAVAKEFLRLGRQGSPLAVRSREVLLEGSAPAAAWPPGGLLALGGRTLDLKSAY